MINEDLEFQISQYADGSLPAEQYSVVEEAIRSNPAAQKALRDYQKIHLHVTGLRKTHVIHWHRLAEHLSDVVHRDLEVVEHAVAGRIFPAINTWTFRSAVAAVIVFALGGTLWMKGHQSVSPVISVPTLNSSSSIAGPEAEVATGPAVQEINVGPSPALARSISSWRYADGVVTNGPAKVTITAGITPAPNPNLR